MSELKYDVIADAVKFSNANKTEFAYVIDNEGETIKFPPIIDGEQYYVVVSMSVHSGITAYPTQIFSIDTDNDNFKMEVTGVNNLNNYTLKTQYGSYVGSPVVSQETSLTLQRLSPHASSHYATPVAKTDADGNITVHLRSINLCHLQILNNHGDMVYELYVKQGVLYECVHGELVRSITIPADKQSIPYTASTWTNLRFVQGIDLGGLPSSNINYNTISGRLKKITNFGKLSGTTMHSFTNCFALQAINGIDSNTATSMSNFASCCYNLSSITECTFPNVTNGSSAFAGCHSLKSIDMTMFPSLKTGSTMFYNCKSLEIFDYESDIYVNGTIIGGDLDSLKSLRLTLPNCNSALPSLQYAPQCSSVTYNTGFSGGSSSGSIAQLKLSSATTIADVTFPNATYASNLFSGNSGLVEVKVDMAKLTTSFQMFTRCTNLKKAIVNIPSVTNFTSTFQYCSALTYAELIVSASQSALTQSQCSMPTSAPASKFRTVQVVDDNLVKIIFSEQSYRIIDHAPYVFDEGGEYHLSGISEQVIIGTDHEDAEYNVTFVNENDFPVTIHGNNTDTTGETLTLQPNQIWTGTVYVFWTRFGDGWFLGFTPAD